MDKRTDERKNGGWMDGWMDGWTDGKMDGCTWTNGGTERRRDGRLGGRGGRAGWTNYYYYYYYCYYNNYYNAPIPIMVLLRCAIKTTFYAGPARFQQENTILSSCT